MSQDTWNFIFIGISFALYIGIALKSRASSTKEYYTAGGGVSPFANGMATAADWMSWLLLLTGCLLLRLFLWLEGLLSVGMMGHSF